MNNTNRIDNTTEMPIRLHYIWFKDNNTFFNQGINFSSKYNFSYDSVSGKLKVTDPLNEKYVDDFFGNSIDVTAIVGQNGAGKTTLLKFIQSLRNGVIYEDCVVVCEKNSEFWAARYYSDGRQPTKLPIEGNNTANIVEIDNIKPEESIFPFSEDIRFIYMTEMFNMSQYEASSPGTSSGDDMSFAAVLYRQSEYGDEEKHTLNPVTRYIHRITDWQLDFISNGAKYVEKFDITYPRFLIVKPNYDIFAFEKLYMAVKGKVQNKIRQSSNNEYDKEATILSKKLFGTSENLKDEYAKAIIMNIISSFEYDADVSYEKRMALYNKLESSYSSDSGTWKSTENFLKDINKYNEEYENSLNEHNGRITKDKGSFYINAKPYIEFMKYLEKFFEGKNLYKHIIFDIKIPTSNMTIIYDFVKEYSKCVLIVDFLSFSWGLSSGENLLLNQFGKIMHLLKKDSKGYYLSEDSYPYWPVKNAVIMLDEAEVAFHPAWQRRYFNAFLNFINQNIAKRGTHVQIIIATHSPIILSDIPKQNTVFLKCDNKTKRTTCVKSEETFASNIFSLYNNAFFMDESEIGAFAEEKLCKLVKTIHSLFEEPCNVSKTDHKEVRNQIALIGDPYIRRKFEKEYQYCKDIYDSDHPDIKKDLDEEIAVKERELEALRHRREELGEKHDKD
ncbi:MAG: AAA family ATPase [Anaerobutyricum hallii]|uniref:AAA family ATPase n=1 Tax=Anaerobutyricum hallii TaxID=39488 RepID=UPI002A8174C2|nr:AAA family ATPase [Anaerobutyricum hallii]MDY4579061.1 AAA family ATPase [Anaerobutyricum hallii]